MSIIYDALKKIEDGGSKKERSVAAAPLARASAGLPTLPPNIAGACIVIAIVSAIAAGASSLKAAKPGVAGASPVTFSSSDASVSEQPTPAASRPRYRLEGILYDDDLPSAIINGRILHVADQLDGLIVKTITNDSVELITMDDDSPLTLSLSL